MRRINSRAEDDDDVAGCPAGVLIDVGSFLLAKFERRPGRPFELFYGLPFLLSMFVCPRRHVPSCSLTSPLCTPECSYGTNLSSPLVSFSVPFLLLARPEAAAASGVYCPCGCKHGLGVMCTGRIKASGSCRAVAARLVLYVSYRGLANTCDNGKREFNEAQFDGRVITVKLDRKAV